MLGHHHNKSQQQSLYNQQPYTSAVNSLIGNGNYNGSQKTNLFESSTTASLQVEQAFCRDFNCCGIALKSLHDLLEHYETTHVLSPKEQENGGDDQSINASPENPWFSKSAFNTSGQHSFLYNNSHNNNNNILSINLNSSNNNNNTNGFGPYNSLEDYQFMTNMQEQPVLTVTPSSLSSTSDAGAASGDDSFALDEEEMGDEEFDFEHDPSQAYRRYIQSIRRKERSKRRQQTSAVGPDGGDIASNNNTAMSIITAVATGGPFPQLPRTRKYQCMVPGCGQVYRNQNGLKYHTTHFHTILERQLADHIMQTINDDPSTKPYACRHPGCDKRYRNSNGLKYHLIHHHGVHPTLSATSNTQSVKQSSSVSSDSDVNGCDDVINSICNSNSNSNSNCNKAALNASLSPSSETTTSTISSTGAVKRKLQQQQ